MVAWKRFPVPEFNYSEFQDMAWSTPDLLDRAAADKISARIASGADAPAACCVKLDDLLARRFGFSGDHLHAVACGVAKSGGHLLGRSHAWKIQRMLLLNAADMSVVADWSTPRPMNTRLGPENGIELQGGSYLAICGHKYGEGWIGSRTLVQNGLSLCGNSAYRVLAASDDDLDDFHHVCLTMSWKA